MTVHEQPTRPTGAVAAHAAGAPPTWTPPTDPAPDGRPARPGKHRAKIAVAGAIVAAAVVGGGVTAAVVSSGDGSSTQAGGPGGGQGGFGGPGGTGTGAAGGLMTALHGTYVVSDGNGGYTTQLTQTGTVSAVSASSITVKSADGYTKKYVISSSTAVDNGDDAIADVAAGHTVQVVASSAGDKVTATTITDTTIATTTTQQGGPGGGQGGPAQQGGTGA